MKIWFNKVNESRRSMVEVTDAEVTIGRDPANSVCLQSPLVSRQHAVVRPADGKLQLENIGLNSCLVGEEEVLGGQTAVFDAGHEGPHLALQPHLRGREGGGRQPRPSWRPICRSIMADLELRIHRKLLERLDLYQFEANRGSDPQSIVLLGEQHRGRLPRDEASSARRTSR